MRPELNLSQLARAIDMKPGDLANELKRGNVPGVPSSTGSPGKPRYFDLRECVFVAVYAALRNLTPTNKRLGLRAQYAAPEAAQILGQILAQQPQTGIGLAIVPRPGGKEWLGVVRNERELVQLVTLAVGSGDPVEVLPFAPIFQRLMNAIAQANGIRPDQMERRTIGAAEPPPTMPGATAEGPQVDTAEGKFGQFPTAPDAAYGMRVDDRGIAMWGAGIGFLFDPTAEDLRRLEGKLRALRESREGTEPGDRPEPSADHAFDPRAVAGRA